MKIQKPTNINPIQSYQQKYKNELKQDKGTKLKSRDQVQISQQALEMLGQAGESGRKEKVAQLKDAYQNGSFKVDSRQVAEKLYQSWFDPRG